MTGEREGLMDGGREGNRERDGRVVVGGWVGGGRREGLQERGLAQ